MKKAAATIANRKLRRHKMTANPKEKQKQRNKNKRRAYLKFSKLPRNNTLEENERVFIAV